VNGLWKEVELVPRQSPIASYGNGNSDDRPALRRPSSSCDRQAYIDLKLNKPSADLRVLFTHYQNMTVWKIFDE